RNNHRHDGGRLSFRRSSIEERSRIRPHCDCMRYRPFSRNDPCAPADPEYTSYARRPRSANLNLVHKQGKVDAIGHRAQSGTIWMQMIAAIIDWEKSSWMSRIADHLVEIRDA